MRDSSTRPRSRPRWGRAWVPVCVALGLLAPTAQTKEVDGIVRLIFTRTKALESSADRRGGTFDVRWNRHIGRPLSYQLSARYTTQNAEPLLIGSDTFADSQLTGPKGARRHRPRPLDREHTVEW